VAPFVRTPLRDDGDGDGRMDGLLPRVHGRVTIAIVSNSAPGGPVPTSSDSCHPPTPTATVVRSYTESVRAFALNSNPRGARSL